MRALRALAPLSWRSGGRDSRVLTALALVAFAVSTALTLSVVGALLGFQHRAAHPANAYQADAGGSYVLFAWTALVLLVVPLVTLGGAAARLGVARRDARLATLRLLGVTPGEVVGLTLVQTAAQGLAGAVAGMALYGALLPVWTRIAFQGAPFTARELWVGLPVLGVAALAVPLLAAGSGLVSLRRVVVSPLGVARRVTPPRLRAVRAVAAVAGILAFVVLARAGGGLGAALVGVLIGALALGFALLNAVGPWALGVLGRFRLRRARTVEALLAARRLLDDPRATWRVVGGLGLAGFVAGALAVVPVLTERDGGSGDAGARTLGGDLLTGAMLTLAIAFLLAAVSAGVAQAAAVLDRRREYALARLAGMPVELFDRVRRREVLVPMLVVGVGSAVVALAMLFPVFGWAALVAPHGLLLLVGCLAGGCVLVLATTETSRPLLRSVLAQTVVRAD